VAAEVKDFNLNEIQALIRDVIKNQLYPANVFPRTLFPDLDQILLKHFTDFLKANTNRRNSFQLSRNDEELKEMINDILCFESILGDYPQIIILIYRRLISRYIYSKHMIFHEREDILQEVITRLLSNKMGKIQELYDFKFKKNPSFTSYFMVTVRNIYIDIIREGKNKMLSTVNLDDIRQPLPETNLEFTSNKLFIEEELTKLYFIFRMYYKSQPKIELCLKIKFRIPMTPDDILKYFPHCSADDINQLSQDFRFKKDKRVFESIIGIFNRNEGKQNKSDTLRKWITVKIDEIILHLNRTHNDQVYNQKNIPDLVNLYYQNKNLFKGDQ
jgi:hypothetical protein